MRILVTGGHGGVGRAVVPKLQAAGHDVVVTDIVTPRYDEEVDDGYLQADLTDPSEARWVVDRVDAIVHAAAIPDPTRNAPATVMRNNALATFNVVEAAVMSGVTRIVNLSSETVVGFQFAFSPFLPEHLPISEATPTRPQDAYALSKLVGELTLDAAVARTPSLSAISLRPSWVQYPSTYERNLGAQVRDAGVASSNLWSYVDADDLADAVRRACEVQSSGHEVMFIVNPDIASPLPLAGMIHRHFPNLAVAVDPSRDPAASAFDCGKAARLLGWVPPPRWRQHIA